MTNHITADHSIASTSIVSTGIYAIRPHHTTDELRSPVRGPTRQSQNATSLVRRPARPRRTAGANASRRSSVRSLHAELNRYATGDDAGELQLSLCRRRDLNVSPCGRRISIDAAFLKGTAERVLRTMAAPFLVIPPIHETARATQAYACEFPDAARKWNDVVGMATKGERFRYRMERSGPDLPKKPRRRRRDHPVDTSKPSVSATDRRAGGTSTAARNKSKAAAKKAPYVLEDSRTRPSRKGTRSSLNRQRPDNNLRRRAVRITTSPSQRASRA